MTAALDQLQSIHAMLNAGQRSVRLERHSLWLLGGIGGFVIAVTESVITADRFPSLNQRALALLCWLVLWLGGLCVADHHLTRRARAQRDETLSFAQAQLTRAWWMLLVMGTLGSIGMFFHGGGVMIYVLWMVLLGLGLYLFGLFSQTLFEWIGLATILIGVVALSAGLTYHTTHWLAASCFGLGMPLAGWLRNRVHEHTPRWRQVLALGLWITAVALPPVILSQHFPTQTTPTGPVVQAHQVQALAEEQVLTLPAGTPVQLRVNLSSPVLMAQAQDAVTLTLQQPMDVVLQHGKPDGRYRIGGDTSRWHGIRDGVLGLRITQFVPELVDGHAVIRAQAEFGQNFLPGDGR